ncbi:hypothetical protein Q3G72_033134 [Acer saccharum]|nr:hypothetical protein Q3G72_033134 [Acer saccharum]
MVWSWSFKANVAITEILISHGLVVDSISFASIDENDEIKYSERFGGDGGKSEKKKKKKKKKRELGLNDTPLCLRNGSSSPACSLGDGSFFLGCLTWVFSDGHRNY